MGLNVDLTQMLGVPKKLACPKCNHKIDTMFADYDIEAGDPNPKKGRWVLDVWCDECDHEFEYKFEVRVVRK